MRYFINKDYTFSTIKESNRDLFNLMFNGSLQYVTFTTDLNDLLDVLLNHPSVFFKRPGNWGDSDRHFGLSSTTFSSRALQKLLGNSEHIIISDIKDLRNSYSSGIAFMLAFGYSPQIDSAFRNEIIDNLLKEL